jgi:hypothetical protein
MSVKRFLIILATVLAFSAPAMAGTTDAPVGGHPATGGVGHFADGHGTWARQPGWAGSGSGTIRHFNPTYWRSGHWWHGTYWRRVGWWWIVGPDWYWYPAAVYPYPNPFTPPEMTVGLWYWCDAYQQYYPYVGACPSGWRAVPMQSP